MSKANILVVDDQDSIRHFVCRALEDEGYTVLTAGSVRETREAIEPGMPDMAILDLKLPDGTGLDVIAALRARHVALPIIVITSYSSLESAIGALRGGAVDYVIKPFKNDDLLAAIARALHERRLVRTRPLAIEAYIRDVVERFQDAYSEKELARMLGIGRKALWMRRRQWGLKRARKSVS